MGSLDLTGEIEFATRSFAKAVGVTQEQLRGGNFLAMLDPVDRTEISDFMRHTREGTLRTEIRILREGADCAGPAYPVALSQYARQLQFRVRRAFAYPVVIPH